MIPTQPRVQSMLNRLAAAKDLIYPDLESCERAGFVSVGTGLLLRAGAGAVTEVWSIEPTQDGQIQLFLRSDLGYDPELRSATIERKVIKASKASVDTPYGPGTLVQTTDAGNPVVAFSVDGQTTRYILNASDVKPMQDQAKVSITLQAKDPEKTSTATYLQQYYYEMYGSEAYAKELASSFGDLWPE